AEDGIRDFHVTGVQTCALPIWDTDGLHRYAHPLLRDAVLSGWTSGRRREAHRAAAEELMREGAPVGAVAWHLHHGAAVGEPWARSEERRVGKEWDCRSGGEA